MPNARTLDPSTSHQAAASVKNVSKTQQVILKLLTEYALTDQDLIQFYNHRVRTDASVPRASESGIRSRRAELVELGLVVDSGSREKLSSGRSAIVWSVA